MAGLLALLFLVGLVLLAAAIDGKTQKARYGAGGALALVIYLFFALLLEGHSKPASRGSDRDAHAHGDSYKRPQADWPYSGRGYGSTQFERMPYARDGRSPGWTVAPQGKASAGPDFDLSRLNGVGVSPGEHAPFPPLRVPESGAKPQPATDVAAVERMPLDPAAQGERTFVGVQEWVPALSPIRE